VTKRCAWAAVLVLFGLPLRLGGQGFAEETLRPASPGGVAAKAAHDGALRLSHPKAPPVAPPAPAALEASVRRGVEFLLARQNKNGSWGSAHNTTGLDIYAPTGSHEAFRAGTTALCLSALMEIGDRMPGVPAAIDRGQAWFLENVGKVRRATPDTLYNSWAHAYAIDYLSRVLLAEPKDSPRSPRLLRLVEQQIGMLGRYECVDGGWCYYDFNAHTQQPSGSSISFVSAACLVALERAKRAGASVPQRLVKRAMASIRRQRKPDFSYCYGEYLKYMPMHPVNMPGGSLGRSQACNLAMRLWGDASITDEVLSTWLDRLFARNGWLDIGRKRPIPHESWFSVAGYFFYFGHYYAALCIQQLPPPQRPEYQDHLARVLLQLQEKDGSWWDFPMYDYHQPYGTAFALMSLGHCRHAAR